jgi:hypothetical protein
MRHQVFMNQIRRFAGEALPTLQALPVTPRAVDSLSH